jgi:hypothetical protein
VSGKQTAKDDEKISEEDHQTISTIVLGWIFYWNMLMKITPEDYAERVFLKIGKSKKKPGTIRTLFDLIRETSNSVKSPDEFNQALAREILDQSMKTVSMDEGSHLGNQEHLRRYLDRRRMSEILQFLTDRRVLRHIRGKQAIRKEMHRLPGRIGSRPFNTFGERFGGQPSAYMKTNLVERINRLLRKPQARNLVYTVLKKTNILYEYEWFMLSAFYISLKRRKHIDIRKNVSMAQAVINATDNNPEENPETELMVLNMLEQIANYDEYQIKRFAAEKAKESIKRRKDDAYFLMGLFLF